MQDPSMLVESMGQDMDGNEGFARMELLVWRQGIQCFWFRTQLYQVLCNVQVILTHVLLAYPKF